MTAGLPVVATPAGAIADVIADGVNGRLLPADPTVEEVAATLADLLGDPDELAAIGDRNRRAARETFEWEVIVEAILGTYEAAIDERRSRLEASRGGGARPTQGSTAERAPAAESGAHHSVTMGGSRTRSRSSSGTDDDGSVAAGNGNGNGQNPEIGTDGRSDGRGSGGSDGGDDG
jgi:hypothetical protein